MKNLGLLLIVMGLSTQVLFSQGLSNVAAGQTNISKIWQTGNYGSATVDQTGTFMTSLINQLSSSETSKINVKQVNFVGSDIPVYSEISQKNDGIIRVTQTASATMGIGPLISVISQEGVMQYAELNQTGSNNTSEIIQKMGENVVTQEQGGFSNTLKAYQPGHASTINQVQYGSKNYAEAVTWHETGAFQFQDQNSSENFAYIITGMSGNGYQTQSGNRNKASIDQVNTAINVNAYQEQAGDDNSATIVQNGGESLSKQSQKGNWNNVEIYQTGHFNHAEQNQQLFSMNNNAVITQDGFFNNAVQQQKGYLGQEKIDQENSSSSGLAVNYAKQEQDALLGRSSNSLDPLNEASILQSSGNGNYAFQKQFSTGGDVVLNEVISIQKGDFNHSEQYQSGQANYSFLQQDGKANSLLINQKN